MSYYGNHYLPLLPYYHALRNAYEREYMTIIHHHHSCYHSSLSFLLSFIIIHTIIHYYTYESEYMTYTYESEYMTYTYGEWVYDHHSWPSFPRQHYTLTWTHTHTHTHIRVFAAVQRCNCCSNTHIWVRVVLSCGAIISSITLHTHMGMMVIHQIRTLAPRCSGCVMLRRAVSVKYFSNVRFFIGTMASC
jgi:hypothetical protein